MYKEKKRKMQNTAQGQPGIYSLGKLFLADAFASLNSRCCIFKDTIISGCPYTPSHDDDDLQLGGIGISSL